MLILDEFLKRLTIRVKDEELYKRLKIKLFEEDKDFNQKCLEWSYQYVGMEVPQEVLNGKK